MIALTYLTLTTVLFAACVGASAGAAPAVSVPRERPNTNILGITVEDICPNLGYYGNPDGVTPNLDKFAPQGVRLSQVFWVHPCCSSIRSCLATVVYPTRLGTLPHRGKTWVKAELVKCFPPPLREADYYTFNGCKGDPSKLDYNFTPQDKPWDMVESKQVEWRNRKPWQPFFGQVNLPRNHQSQYGQRKVGAKDPKPAPESFQYENWLSHRRV